MRRQQQGYRPDGQNDQWQFGYGRSRPEPRPRPSLAQRERGVRKRVVFDHLLVLRDPRDVGVAEQRNSIGLHRDALFDSPAKGRRW